MLTLAPTPLIRLGNLFPQRAVYAKCEFLAPSGCFKIRGALQLLEHLRRQERPQPLIVPSMGNTALGAAVGGRVRHDRRYACHRRAAGRHRPRALGDKLRALGVELIKIAGGGSDLLRCATQVAGERGGYFVHPHLDPLWTDGYQSIAAEVLDLPLPLAVFPLGGGGLLMGPVGLRRHPRGPAVRLRAVQLPEIRSIRPRPLSHCR